MSEYSEYFLIESGLMVHHILVNNSLIYTKWLLCQPTNKWRLDSTNSGYTPLGVDAGSEYQRVLHKVYLNLIVDKELLSE